MGDALKGFKAAKQALHKACEFVGLIGKPQTQTTARGCYGHISSIEVTTTVHFQPYDGATNYHKCEEFDAALAEVIREQFGPLRDAALDKLTARVADLNDAAAAEYKAEFGAEIGAA